MTGHIIDPMWFYWAEVATCAKVAFIFLAIAFGALAVLHIMLIVENGYIGYAAMNDTDKKSFRIALISIAIGLIFLALAIFIPTKETMLQMKIAEYATYENIESVITEIEETAEKIMGD